MTLPDFHNVILINTLLQNIIVPKLSYYILQSKAVHKMLESLPCPVEVPVGFSTILEINKYKFMQKDVVLICNGKLEVKYNIGSFIQIS